MNWVRFLLHMQIGMHLPFLKGRWRQDEVCWYSLFSNKQEILIVLQPTLLRKAGVSLSKSNPLLNLTTVGS